MPEYLKRGAVQTAERSRQISDTVSAILSDAEMMLDHALTARLRLEMY